MAQSHSFEPELVSIIKSDGKGWRKALFEDIAGMSQTICAHCNAICCDPVELDCDIDHDDEDIFLHCHLCLKQLIDPEEKVVNAVAETDLDLTIINFSELEKLLKGTDKNLSALIKSLISQGIY